MIATAQTLPLFGSTTGCCPHFHFLKLRFLKKSEDSLVE
jgi:hypothetical protein